MSALIAIDPGPIKFSQLSPSELKTPIVVGLSGGVDSSVAIARLKQQGFDVIGVTLWLMKGKGQCCSEGMVDAARLCEELSVPYHVVDSRDVFTENIINYLVEGYSQGITPLPCSQCNRMVKFGPMLAYARAELGANHIATGHYARIYFNPETQRYELWRAVDQRKDQSYFLYDLTQEHLAHTVFPLGELTKDQTRSIAADLNLHTAEKPESQDLCLVEAHGSMRDFLAQYIPPQAGEIVNQSGQVLGYHEGIHNYTIGQRKGIGIAAAEPLYVVALDTERNQVIVGPRHQAEQAECLVSRVNWVSIGPTSEPFIAQVQVRYQTKAIPATITPLGDSSQVKIIFSEPQFGVTPGQAAVWYAGDRVLGGGIIG